MAISSYEQIGDGGFGYIEQPRGLIAVSGGEAVQFLDGMITNDIKKLAVGAEMIAAFPNAQGRLLALVRIRERNGSFLIETEAATHQTLYDNLFRFTFAGDFAVEDVSGNYRYFELFGDTPHELSVEWIGFSTGRSFGAFAPANDGDEPSAHLANVGGIEITDDELELLRIEAGIPRYGMDMGETTIIPELGLDGMIAYDKGCYVGQEIIARIHFRGHVAKQLRGLVLSEPGDLSIDSLLGAELTDPNGKSAGRITSAVFSPRSGRSIALAYVRYEFLDDGTQLLAGDHRVTVRDLPFTPPSDQT